VTGRHAARDYGVCQKKLFQRDRYKHRTSKIHSVIESAEKDQKASRIICSWRATE
jgi:hypothetical protein